MTASTSELAVLRTVASRFGPLREEVVFVGGMIRGLLISDPGASGSRPTDDIDVVAEVGSRAEYYELAERLQALGFEPDRRERAPLCRWLIEGLTVDVMPDHEDVLGFTNRWYPSARATALWQPVGNMPHDRIRVIDAPHFAATKLEAFRGRGGSDFYHHDMEDLIAVVDGRAELLAELEVAPDATRAFVASEISSLMSEEAFRETLPGHLAGDKASQARLPLVEQRLFAMAAIRP